MFSTFVSTTNLPRLAILFIFTLASSSVFADATNSDIQWGIMAMTLFGGLALFLFGMEQMSSSLKAVAGNRMRNILSSLTTNRFMGAITGAFVTAVIQSSSVTTVLVVGFISAGLMTLSQSVGVIMGANIGTTITAQIVAFKVTKAAMLMIAVGFFMLFAGKHEKVRQYGEMLMGLGLVFFGMSIMSEAMAPLRSYQPFLDLMMQMENPLLGIIVAALFTGLVQSSSATTGIVIVMASQGLITLPAGIALSFGANVGTCITALLAAIGKPREATRAASVHVFFNVAGVALWLMFIPQLAELVMYLSPIHNELSGVQKLAAETPRQIANAHTIFNIANTLIFIGFTTQIALLVEKLLPDLPEPEKPERVKAQFLDSELIGTPSLALDRVRSEVQNMGQRVEKMFDLIMPALLSGNRNDLNKIRNMDDDVDSLYEQIIEYLGKISQQPMNEKQTQEFLSLMEAISNLENIGDTIETNLVGLGLERLRVGVSISDSTRKILSDFHKTVGQALTSSIFALSQNDLEAAKNVISMKKEISLTSSSANMHQAQRLIAEEPNRISAYTIEVDIIEKQKRIYYFAKRIAKSVYDLA